MRRITFSLLFIALTVGCQSITGPDGDDAQCNDRRYVCPDLSKPATWDEISFPENYQNGQGLTFLTPKEEVCREDIPIVTAKIAFTHPSATICASPDYARSKSGHRPPGCGTYSVSTIEGPQPYLPKGAQVRLPDCSLLNRIELAKVLIVRDYLDEEGHFHFGPGTVKHLVSDDCTVTIDTSLIPNKTEVYVLAVLREDFGSQVHVSMICRDIWGEKPTDAQRNERFKALVQKKWEKQ